MMNNPEFKRNIWLELSLHRLIAAPVLLGLIFFVAMQNDNGGAVAHTIAKSIFIIATILWGSQLAFSSVSDELQNRTWDNQRLSALSPFKLAWGKLFGATSFAWYIGIPCILVMLIMPAANSAFINSATGLSSNNLQTSIGLVLGALLAQSFAFVLALLAAKSGATLPKGFSLLFLFVLMPIVGRMIYTTEVPTQLWYGTAFTRYTFVNISLLIFTAWTWLASVRVMQTALQVKIKPWAMLAFVLFGAFYILGFYNAFSVGNFAGFVFIFAILMTYFGALTEKRDLVSVRRFINPWLAETLQKTLPENSLAEKALPEKKWLETPYFVVMAALSLVALLFTLSNKPQAINAFEQSILKGQSFALVGLVLVLLMLRDIGLLYYFSLSKKPQRAAMTTFFYVMMLTVLFPLLLPKSLGFIANPLISQSSGVYGSLILALLHVAVVAGLLYKQQVAMSKSFAN